MTPTKTVAKVGRHYVWPLSKPYELEVPSVTNIIGKGIPKEALAPWNAKMVATFAVEHKDSWVNLPDEDAIDLLKRSPYRTTDRSARAGKIVHNAIEQYAAGIDHEPPTDKALRLQYEACLRFLEDFKVKVSHTEVTIFSRQHEYAGTTDVLGGVTIPKGVVANKVVKGRAIIDYKTGKRIYDEHSIQLNAYAHGDFIAHEDGTEETLGEFDFLMVVRPKKRGGYEVRIFEPTDETFDIFLAARVVAKRDDVLGEAQIGRVLTGPDEGVE